LTEHGREPYDRDQKKLEAFRLVEDGDYDHATYAIGGVFGHSNEVSDEEAVKDAKALEEVCLYILDHDRPFTFGPGFKHPALGKAYGNRAWTAYNEFQYPLKIYERVFGKSSVEVVAAKFNWARAAYFIDRDKTTETVERAISIEKRKLGRGHPVYLEHLIMIAEMKLNNDKAKVSIEHFEEAIAALETLGDDGRELLARALKGYTLALRGANRWPEAENASFRYTSLLEAMGKGMSEESREGWLDLAEVRFEAGNLAGADEAATWALNMGSQIHGGATMHDRRSLEVLVDLSIYWCDLERARELQDQLLQIILRSEGAKAPEAVPEYLKLVDILLEWPRPAEAFKAIQDVQDCDFPQYDVDGFVALFNFKLAKYYRVLGDFNLAESTLNEAFDEFWASPDSIHKDLYIMPIWYRERFELDLALGRETDVMTRSWSGIEHYKIEHDKIIRTAILSAMDYMFYPDYIESFIRSSIARAERENSWNHLTTIEARTDLATCLIRQQQTDAAERVLNKNVRLLKRMFGDRHPELARTYRELARMLIARNQLGLAEDIVRNALAMDSEIYGAGNYAVADDHELISDIRAIRGDIRGALHSMDDALTVHLAVEGRIWSLDTVRLSVKTANMFTSIGEMLKAANYLEAAQTVLERNLGKDHPRTRAIAQAYTNARR